MAGMGLQEVPISGAGVPAMCTGRQDCILAEVVGAVELR